MRRYLYSVIRYVPDPATGEFVNIGAIAGSDAEQEWEYRLSAKLSRANALARAYDADGSLVSAHASRLCSTIDDFNSSFEGSSEPQVKVTEQWLRDTASRMRHVLQMSAPMPISAEDSAAALSQVFEQLIPEPETRSRATDKRKACRAARDAFEARGLVLGTHVFEEAVVQGANHPASFEYAVANGRAVQLVKAWSFQMQNQVDLATSIRAWAYGVTDIRKNGGSFTLSHRESRLMRVDKDIDLAVVYVPPPEGGGAGDDTFYEAKSAFHELGIHAHPYTEALSIADRAQSLLNHASTSH